MASCKRCNSTVGLVAAVGFCNDCLGSLIPPNKGKAETKIVQSGWALNNSDETSNHGNTRILTVDPAMAEKLHIHQKEGARFIYRNSFPDCSYFDVNAHESKINGCILAHFMGLGKSLTVISVLYTVMACRTLVSKAKNKPLLHTALLVVPANTLTNWIDEVDKWTSSLDFPLKVHNLGGTVKGFQENMLKKWNKHGGLLLLSETHFLNVGDKIVKNYPPDILVIDEAHTMLKNPSTKTFKKLRLIKTKRRICLTGTPLQNNLTEYYHMLEFVKPGVVGVNSVAEFEKTYRDPVERGLPCDASLEEKLEGLEKQVELKRKLEPYVHRKGARVLRENLPPIQDTLLYLEPSRIQEKLMKSHKRQQKNGELTTNFFSAYAQLAPLLNHPGCLKVAKGGRGAKISWKAERDAWLMPLKQPAFDKLHASKNSPKLIMLAHILAMATGRSQKVLIYSKCLKTLDLVEEFLAYRDWKSRLGSLADHFKDWRLGGWKKNTDYVRIDGGVSSGKRGEMVESFNDTKSIKAFLISSLAGGVGINLCSASVVVILDNHFNPSVSSQCVSRAHRFGQKKPVSVFRLAIRDSVESKVYKRSVNKTGVASSVLDGIHFDGGFATHELDDLQNNDIILTCDKCRQRRVLPEKQDVPDDGFICSMNKDPLYNSCAVKEDKKLQQLPFDCDYDANNSDNRMLQHLRQVVNSATMQKRIVAGFCPVEENHESEICCDEGIKKLKKEIAAKVNKTKAVQHNREDEVLVVEVRPPPAKRKHDQV